MWYLTLMWRGASIVLPKGDISKCDEGGMELKANVMIQVPVSLKVALEQYCEVAKVPVSGFIRKLVADAIDYKLPATSVGRSRKYATPEERMAAQKTREKQRKALVKQLLAKYSAGEITIDDVMNSVADGSDE